MTCDECDNPGWAPHASWCSGYLPVPHRVDGMTVPPMTKERLLEILRDDCNGDTERAHSVSDTALLHFINDPEITEAFNSQTRWCG